MNFAVGQKFAAAEYFQPLVQAPVAEFVREAEQIERTSRIENHEFFQFAKNSASALVLWASQEAVVTNPFSQILFRVIGDIRNVHVRSVLMPVVAGEHSSVRSGIAASSHPWLIWQLCRSVGLRVRPGTLSRIA
jgi:hypothetical protein